MGTEGYIKLHRKVLSNEMFLELPFDRWRAFEFLMLSARYKPTDIILKGNIVHLDVGQTIFGEEKLAKNWGWSRGKVHRFLIQLSELGMIQHHGTPNGTIITIENYTLYQCEQTADGTADNTANGIADGTTDGTTDGTHTKKEKKVKNNNRAFKPPLLDEVKQYCLERGNSVNAETFIDFYESKGWMVGKNKMRDWKAAVRTWEKNRTPKAKQSTSVGDWEEELLKESANGKS